MERIQRSFSSSRQAGFNTRTYFCILKLAGCPSRAAVTNKYKTLKNNLDSFRIELRKAITRFNSIQSKMLTVSDLRFNYKLFQFFSALVMIPFSVVPENANIELVRSPIRKLIFGCALTNALGYTFYIDIMLVYVIAVRKQDLILYQVAIHFIVASAYTFIASWAVILFVKHPGPALSVLSRCSHQLHGMLCRYL